MTDLAQLFSDDLYPHVEHDVSIFTRHGRVYLYCETCDEDIVSLIY